LRDYVAPPPPEGSLDETLVRVGSPFLALDLRKLPGAGPVGEWWKAPHVTRSTGAVFSDDPEERAWFARPTTFQSHFDALLFVLTTTAARRNPDRKSWNPNPAMTQPAPTNLGFGNPGPDGMPSGWYGWLNGPTQRRRIGYELELGDGSASLWRRGVPWEWGQGSLNQTFDAKPFRGKRLTIRAEGKVQPETEFDGAYLEIGAFKGEPDGYFQSSDWPARGTTAEKPWTADVWQTREISIVVPQEVDRITVSLILSGNGRAWFRALSIESGGEGGG
jgi:hypothetical protein